MTGNTTDFEEMHPIQKDGANNEFNPLLGSFGVAHDDFSDVLGESRADAMSVAQDEAETDNFGVIGCDTLDSKSWDSTSLSVDTHSVSDNELQVAWDDGYAAGATESGSIEASKFSAKLDKMKKEFQSSLGAISFSTEDIVLSDKLISMFKKYCDEVSKKVFGQEIREELLDFIDEKVTQFACELKANEPTIEVTVSAQNFQSLKDIGATVVNDGIKLSDRCTIYSSQSMGDDDFCRVVADVEGNEIKADLNLASVKQELDSVGGSLEQSRSDELLGGLDGLNGSMGDSAADEGMSDLKKLMTSSLEGVDLDLDDLPPIDDYASLNAGLGR
ncbi:hypothetical protein [Photobacterium damselae]|uniref:hypothetical protein n=1 Tax=Photobacterium damselae TaxID=38293 RepID=UPI004067CB20